MLLFDALAKSRIVNITNVSLYFVSALRKVSHESQEVESCILIT